MNTNKPVYYPCSSVSIRGPFLLYGDLRSIEPCEGESVETFVVGQLPVAQRSYRHHLPKAQRLRVVGPVVNPREIAADRDIGGQLVQLSADGKAAGVRSGIGDDRPAVGRRRHRIRNRV